MGRGSQTVNLLTTAGQMRHIERYPRTLIWAIPKDMLQPSEDIDDTRSSSSGFAALNKDIPKLSITFYLITGDDSQNCALSEVIKFRDKWHKYIMYYGAQTTPKY